jgi:hypothetical protein
LYLKQWGLFLLLIIIGGMVACQREPSSPYLLIIEDVDTGYKYIEQPVKIGDRLKLSWIHSVEHTPWEEIIEVQQDEQLHLIETRFQSFGAGVPHESEGKLVYSDDFIIMTNLDRPYKKYSWIHSHYVQHELTLNNKKFVDTKLIPHHRRIIMYLEKR